MLKYLKNLILFPKYVYKNHIMLKKVAKDSQRAIMLNLQNLALNSKESGVAEKQGKQKLIVSLTTYGKRAENVYIIIESLFRQSKKADKIILWLAENEFCDDILPETLNLAKKRGLEIGYCKDIRSYKKLIPTLKKYPNDLINHG